MKIKMKMKRWSGGLFILILSSILVIRYSLPRTTTQPNNPQRPPQPPPQSKQSALDFFRNHHLHDSNSTSHLNNHSVGSSQVSSSSTGQTMSNMTQVVDVEVIDSLYKSVNESNGQFKWFLVWPQLRPVLLRADALADTAKGVKEALTAWKDLFSVIINEGRDKKTSDDVLNDDYGNCPFSVSTFENNNRVIGNSSVLLRIPCGLVEDSSVTLIGIPDVHNASFRIELIGSEVPLEEERAAPIVLHFNVYLPGENSTEEPIIVQNTWTSEYGWGKVQKCPPSRFSNTTEVDGLPSCQEQVIRPSTENVNASDPGGKDKLSNVSLEHIRESDNFPFAEGNPFTATLWTGQEGFHMTVNGRHETSFKYKQNLEPWLVNGVKVSGGLSIISAIAKDLPVSEDLDLTVDVKQLKAPPLLLRKRLMLFIGVFSTGNNFERRMALRRSWMQYEAVRSGKAAVRFVIGFHKSAEVNFKLWKEAEAYGDIQFMPFVDYYSLISVKTVAVCILGAKYIPAKYIMKMDDDAFVRIDEVLSILKQKSPSGLLYGLISFQSSPHRDENSKWYVSYEEWPNPIYPPWAHGPGYIISRDIAKFIIRGHQQRHLKLFKLEDVAMGIWVERFQKAGHDVVYDTDDRFYNAGCDSDYVLAHYQGPRKLLCLWEKLLKEHTAVCCE